MNIIRTTVPGTGTQHRCVSRNGQRFGVLVDAVRLRRLLRYGPAGRGMPLHILVLGREEAARVIGMRPGRWAGDRLAGLDRTRAESTREAP